ncbi:hypothetical protein GOP47_0010620 [Adiantum capillus-veneris]|uniref:Myb/SANT-like domain-containing protein n=1 Tax=Adiantum capillus-veneris TaxID=13818 RepID=A0A9D4UV90_ADICA|nr:hypothetical protein GOP47_0010620 [Adiantum capillus-veneris]
MEEAMLTPPSTGKKRSKIEISSQAQTPIEHPKEQWSHIKKGNFRPRDWEDLVFAINREITGSFNPEHVRNRINTLKVHKKELSKQNSIGSVPSTWIFFDMCDALWGKTPKCSGIAGALDSESHGPVSSTADTPIDLDGVEIDSGSGQNPQPDFVDLDGRSQNLSLRSQISEVLQLRSIVSLRVRPCSYSGLDDDSESAD